MRGSLNFSRVEVWEILDFAVWGGGGGVAGDGGGSEAHFL